MPPDPTSAELPEQADARALDSQHLIDVLQEMVDLGADIARMIHNQAKTATEGKTTSPAHLQAISVAYDRVARAVRRTVLLLQKLKQANAAQHSQRRGAARRLIVRAVADAIQRQAPKDQAIALRAELEIRIDGPDVLEDIDNRPLPAIIADIIHDLGLGAPPGTRPWQRRTPADIAELCELATRISPMPSATVHPLPPRRAPANPAPPPNTT